MPDFSFRSRPVSQWSDADFRLFCGHLTGDPLPRPDTPANLPRLPDDSKPYNIFDSNTYQGLSGSPFEWHREVKARLGQAEFVNQDFAMLKQCIAAGKFDGLDSDTSMAVFEGMANKMATIRYGYDAGSNPVRAADYKSHMALAMTFGGIDLIEDDIDEWRSNMQELLNSEYDKVLRPKSRYICRFFVREDTSESFNPNSGCVFYESGLMDAYVREYVENQVANKQPVKDMFKFMTAPDDFDTKYRITKTAALAQGARIMPKDDWINNVKAQTAFAGMVGWGLSGDKFADTMTAVHESLASGDGSVWLETSRARVARANKLYEDLDALSSLPLDSHGSLKFQPSISMCEKGGWIPANSEKKLSVKTREAAFKRELLVRTADVLYGTQIADKVSQDMRFASKLAPEFGKNQNDLQQVWSAIQSGDFDFVKDKVVDWSGKRLDIIEHEDAAKSDTPLYTGYYNGQVCNIYSKAGAIACTGDVLQDMAVDVCSKQDGLDLPVDDMDLMYHVYCESARVHGFDVMDYNGWSSMVNKNPDLDLLRGEALTVREEISRPVPVLPKDKRPKPVEVAYSSDAPAPDDFLNSPVPIAAAPMYSHPSSPEMENPEIFAHVPDSFDMPEGLLDSFVNSPTSPVSTPVRNMSDLDAVAEEILAGGQVDQSEQELFDSLQ